MPALQTCQLLPLHNDQHHADFNSTSGHQDQAEVDPASPRVRFQQPPTAPRLLPEIRGSNTIDQVMAAYDQEESYRHDEILANDIAEGVLRPELWVSHPPIIRRQLHRARTITNHLHQESGSAGSRVSH